jgi:hypothetical protein
MNEEVNATDVASVKENVCQVIIEIFPLLFSFSRAALFGS